MRETVRAAFGGDAEGTAGRRRAVRLGVLAAVTFVVMAIVTSLPAWRLFDLRAFDYFSTFGHEELAEDAPVIVAIDEPSLADIGQQWPWPRSLHAKLVERLRAAGARAVGLDIIFAEPSTPDADAALAAVLGPDVVLAADESLIRTPQADQIVRTEPLPQFTEKGARVGIASVPLDGDGVLRALPAYPDGFAAELARAADLEPVVEDRRLLQSFGPARTFPTVSYYQALDPENMLPPGFFKGRVVLVGLSLQNAASVDQNVTDAFATSYTVHTGQLLPGVEVQATIFDNLRRNLSVARPGLAAQLLALALAVVVASAVSWRQPDWKSGVAALAATIVVVAMSYLVLRFGRVFVSPLAPVVAYFLVAAGQAGFDYAEERRTRRQIMRAFSQYLAPALVQRLARDPSQLRLGGERRELTVLFTDVRGFTTIAEEMRDDPEALTHLVNRVLTPLSDMVLAHDGTIDKYIGDCLMAFWNAPLADPEHAEHAVSAALGMLDAVRALNAELAEEARAAGTGPRVLAIGIGINTGECVVGNMGSDRRFDYSALGDSVNLASRLEGASKNYGTPLLIGEKTARAVEHRFAVVELDRIRVKGKSELTPVYTVVRALDGGQRQKHDAFLAAYYAGKPLDDFGEAPIAELAAYYRLVRGRQNPVSV